MFNDFFLNDTVQASCIALVTVLVLTFIRDYLPKKNQWVWVALFIQGGLLIHFTHNCTSLDEVTPAGHFAVYDLVCGNTGGPRGYKITEWGVVERFISLLLCFGAVGINVIPKYRKRDLAERHVARIQKSEKAGAMSNPLLFHIITGILTVLGSGIAAQFGKFSDGLIVALVLFDVGHQLSIYRLIPNHDGIWVLRCGNVNLAIVKCITLFRIAEDPQAKTDLIFMYSAGFMFTRVFNFIFGFAHVQWLPKEAWMHEYWYSLGLAGAQFWVQFRTASFSMPCFWFSCIVSSVLYYHSLWAVENRRYLTAINCALFVFSFYATGYTTQVGLCLAYYYFAGFRLPHFHRHRCPRKWRPISEEFSRSNSLASFITPQTSFAVLPGLDGENSEHETAKKTGVEDLAEEAGELTLPAFDSDESQPKPEPAEQPKEEKPVPGAALASDLAGLLAELSKATIEARLHKLRGAAGTASTTTQREGERSPEEAEPTTEAATRDRPITFETLGPTNTEADGEGECSYESTSESEDTFDNDFLDYAELLKVDPRLTNKLTTTRSYHLTTTRSYPTRPSTSRGESVATRRRPVSCRRTESFKMALQALAF